MWGRAFLCASVGVCLPACSTDVFSYSSSPVANSLTAQEMLAAENQPVKFAQCERLADQRADDAVMGLYFTKGSEAYKAVHGETYRACANWENRIAGE